MLDVVKDNKNVEPEVQEDTDKKQGKTSNTLYYAVAIIAGLMLIAIVMLISNKKKGNKIRDE